MAKLLTMHPSQAVSFLQGATLARARTVHCPLCDGTKYALIAARGRQTLRFCCDCGVGFLFPQPTAEELAHHFGGSSEARTSDPERNRRNVLAKVAKYIRHNKSNGTVLDVGCATGFFLAEFFPEPDWRKLAIELSTVYADQAARKGICVFRGGVQEADIPEQSVDVITALDSFYYFRRPLSELAYFRRLLKHNGLLVLEMPVARSRIFRLSGTAGKCLSGIQKSLFEESDHLFYFGPGSMERLLKRGGFRVKEIVMLPANRQDHWARDVGYRAYWRASHVVRALTRSKVFLGPRFLVAAEKC